MEIERLSQELSNAQIKHGFNEDKNRIYFRDKWDKFTSFVEELPDHSLYVRVSLKKIEGEKQSTKELNLCRMWKYRILKKLHMHMNEELQLGFNLEPLPSSPETMKLYPDEKVFKPKTLFEL
ncbi:MAG: hypothetical protein VB138_01870 [Burkholderia sp.]